MKFNFPQSRKSSLTLTYIKNQLVANSHFQVDVAIDEQPNTLHFMYNCIILHLILVIQFGVLRCGRFHDKWHAEVIIYQPSFFLCNQMNFTYQTIYAGAHVSFDLKHRLKEWQVHQLVWSLEIAAVVPFDHWVFKLADTICVTEYLEDAISDSTLLAIVAVGEHRIWCWDCQGWWKPLNRIYVYHTLHIEQIDGYLYGVALAYLIYGLDIWPVHQLLYLKWIEFEWIAELLELLLLLLFVLVHPKYPARALGFDVHLVVCAVFGHTSLSIFAWWNSTLLAICGYIHILTSFSKLIFETSHEALVQMIIMNRLESP